MEIKRRFKKIICIIILCVILNFITGFFTNVYAEENYIITLMSQEPRIINGYNFGQVQGSCMTKNWYVIATEKYYSETNDNTNEFILCEKGDANGNDIPFEQLEYLSLYDLNHVNALTYNPYENRVIISYSTYSGESRIHFLNEEGNLLVDGGDIHSAIYAFAIGYNLSDNTYYAVRTIDANTGARCILKYSNDFNTYEDLYPINTGSLVVQDCFCKDQYLYLCCTEDADENNNRINNSIRVYNLRNGEFVKNMYIPNPENDNATKEEIESGDFYGDDIVLSYDTVIKNDNGKHVNYRSIFLVTDLNREIDLIESVPQVESKNLEQSQLLSSNNSNANENDFMIAGDVNHSIQAVGINDSIQNTNNDNTNNSLTIELVGNNGNTLTDSNSLNVVDNKLTNNVGNANKTDETVANVILPKTGNNMVIYLIVIFVALIVVTWCYISFKASRR